MKRATGRVWCRTCNRHVERFTASEHRIWDELVVRYDAHQRAAHGVRR